MTPEESKRIYYIRAILRNRFEEQGAAFWDEEKAICYLLNAVDQGADAKGLEEHAKQAVNWSSFFNPIRDALGTDLYGDTPVILSYITGHCLASNLRQFFEPDAVAHF